MKKRLGPRICILLLWSLAACLRGQKRQAAGKGGKKESEKNERKGKKREEQKAAASSYTDNAAINCDSALWKYVYNPERLEVIDKCKAVTGTIGGEQRR